MKKYCWYEQCGKEFTKRRKGGRHWYCSTKCRLKDWWTENRKRHNRLSRKAMKRWRRNRTPEQVAATKAWQARYRESNRELLRLAAADYRRMEKNKCDY